MEAADESVAVLAALKGGAGGGDGGIYRRVVAFLLPFADLIPLDTHDPAAATSSPSSSPLPILSPIAGKRRSKKEEAGAAASIRHLGERFLPFLSGALKLLLPAIPKCPREEEGRAAELLAVHRLVLDCLACLDHCLAGKPFSVHLYRRSLLCCLEARGRYAEAEEEAVSLLESLVSAVSPAAPKAAQRGRAAKGAAPAGCARLLPDSTAEGAKDAELAVLVVEVVASLMICAYKRMAKDGAVYHRILSMAEEVQPWLGILDSEAFEKYQSALVNRTVTFSHLLKTKKKYQSALVNALCKCSLFLAGECMSFDAGLVYNFCLTMLRELMKSSSMDQFPKIARQVCSSICLQWESRPSLMLEMLRCSLDSISCKCEAKVVHLINQVFEFVHYIVDNCQTANLDIRKAVFELLYGWRSNLNEVSSAVASVLGIYAIGLDYTTRNGNTHVQRGHGCPSDAAVEFLDGIEHLQIFADSLGSVGCYFRNSDEPTHDVSRKVSSLSLECKTSKSCNQMHGEVSLLSYLDALGFLCKQLEEYVNMAWKHMIAEKKNFHSVDINHVQNAFFQFFDLFLLEFRCNENREKERYHASRLTMIHAAVASLKISLGTGNKIQRMGTCVNQVLSCGWIEPQELKYLTSSFYNVGVSLYNVGLVDKASVALQLCCTTLWTYVSLLCQLFLGKSPMTHSVNLSLDVIKDTIADACGKSAVALDVIHQCGGTNLHNIVTNSLFSWSAAEQLLEASTNPFVLVKQWAKIVCKDTKDVDMVDTVPVLYSLLLSKSETLSKKTLVIILEQELLAYEELDVKYPKLCLRLQLRLIDLLLTDIYATKEYLLPRARILVKKGQALRACGLDGLDSCLQCLSEAISLLKSLCSDASIGNVSLHYQLALAYSLRAHCAQEANQNQKVVLDCVECALNWWSRVSEDIQLDSEHDKIVQLLCGIADLAALKGNLDLQLRVCKLIIVLGNRKNIPIEKCVDMLWSTRRVSHAFCSSPIDENFIMNMSKELGIHANLLSFWMSCMESSPSSLVGFLQRFSLSDSILPRISKLSPKRSLCPRVTVEEVKDAALSMLSSVPVASHSAFAAGCLYFDLSERLFTVGRLFESLSYAREALQLRKKLLHQNFVYLLGEQPGKMEATWNNNHLFGEANGSVITKDWPTFSRSQTLEDCIISPWSVLKCYLESILQVGVLYESIGNGTEAEVLLRMGKTISCSLGFPVLGIRFSCHLGQVYRKKQLLNSAEDELGIAKRFLLENEGIISCNRCIVALHATVDLQIGDLFRSNKSTSNALRQYESALEKLNCVELGDTHSSAEVPLAFMGKKSTLQNDCAQTLQNDDSNMNIGGRRSTKIASSRSTRKQNLIDESSLNNCNGNQTHDSHSRYVGCQKKCNILECANFIDKTACPDICHLEGTHLGLREELQQIYEYSEASICSETNCWRCFVTNVMETGLMHKIIYVKWECHRRRLLLRLLSRKGKCVGLDSASHKVHEIFWQSMSFLFNTEPFCQTGLPNPTLLQLVGMENPYDIFPIQRAVLLYNMGLFCIKDCLSEGSRNCCSISETQIPVVLSWLFVAFILTQEIPLLFQKVSRLIAAILLLSMSTGQFSLPFSFGTLTGSHLAAFFHQASVGTYVQHLYISSVKDKGSNAKVFQGGSLNDRISSSGYLRVAPQRLSDFEGFVNKFFQGLPRFTVICVSLLGGEYENLLGETLLLPCLFPAWMLLSRLDLKEEPIVMLLPVNILREGKQDAANSPAASTSENKESNTQWECPWGYALVDCVAPGYKVILEENYLSLLERNCDVVDAQMKRHMWWSERSRLNNLLCEFLRSMEDSWLGPWRCLLLGECSDLGHLDAVVSKLSHHLKSQCKIEANTSFLKAIFGGGQSLTDIKACISQLLLYKGYLGRGKCCRAESIRALPPPMHGGAESLSDTTHRLICETIDELVQEPRDREPVVLVLDADLQMLPWENIPILRKQEVYRMPSMSSIFATLDRNCHHEQAKGFDAFFPSVDPLDAYYLLNPSGDLSSTQVEFEEWFITQKWEGKAGDAPTTEELADALQRHDLFLYFGHGSGTQYIPGKAIQKLHRCAATLLMGCSSGCLFLRGYYAPHGAPLSYLLAGSPAVIANLWEVSDKDIDRFGKGMLNSWLQEATTTANVTQCRRSTRSAKSGRNVSRNKKLEESSQNVGREFCKRNRIASFMSQARDLCKLPLLIGASPVCYGVPTFIKNHRH